MKIKVINVWTEKPEWPAFFLFGFGKVDHQIWVMFCNFNLIIEL